MIDAYYDVECNFRKQSFPEYYLTLDSFAGALDANELYNAGRPEWVPSGDRFRQHITTMKELGVGADRGDALLKEQRQAVRDLSEIEMHASVSYMRVIAIYKKDPTLLHTLNLPSKDNAKNARRILSAQAKEIHLTLRHLRGVSGAIIIEGTHVRNGGPYLVNLSKGDPTETSWYNPGGHYKSCSKIIFKDLEPANKYYVRMRTDGPDGPGQWSQVQSIIVL